jgi:hypothetical protein
LHVGSMALHNVLRVKRFKNRRSGNSEQPSHRLKQDDSSIIVISQLQAVVAADGIRAYVPTKWELMSRLRSIVDAAVNWIADNARSFSYLLPDGVELALYLSLAGYFALQMAQQQAELAL